MKRMGWIIVLLGVVASLALSANELLRDQKERYEAFQAETTRRASGLRQDILSLGSVLSRINAFYAASDQVSPYEFDLFQDALTETDVICSFCIATGWVPDNADDRGHALIKFEKQLTEVIRFTDRFPGGFYRAIQHPQNLTSLLRFSSQIPIANAKISERPGVFLIAQRTSEAVRLGTQSSLTSGYSFLIVDLQELLEGRHSVGDFSKLMEVQVDFPNGQQNYALQAHADGPQPSVNALERWAQWLTSGPNEITTSLHVGQDVAMTMHFHMASSQFLSPMTLIRPGSILLIGLTIAAGVGFYARRMELQNRILTQARRIAEEASNDKSSFLANMSHEIRTPMNGVLGMAELLTKSEMNAKQRQMLGHLIDSAESLLGIINDILDFSKIEAKQLEIVPAPTDLHELVQKIIWMFLHPAQQKGIDIVMDFPAEIPRNVMVDPVRFRQIVTNLLSNALKFTSAGKVTIAFREDRRKRSTSDDVFNVMISITDTGIGIAPEKLNTVFERFKQADGSTTRRFGGTGLGLAICKQLVEQMGGSMRVESAPGEGSTFWIYMPLLLAKRLDVGSVLEGRWALLVMPGGPDRKSYERLLGGEFYCDFASDARSALKQVATAARTGGPYDVVIIDDGIKDLTAIAFAHTIRGHPSTAQTPVVLLAQQSALMDAAEEDLFNAIVNKPVGATSLLDALRQVCGYEEPIHGEAPDGPPLGAIAAGEAESQPDPLERSAPDLSGAARFDGTRVLLAEDDEVNQLFACSILEDLGCTYRLARTGREALTALAEEKFDIILLDCLMPEMDGYTAAGHIRRMRENREMDNTPLIAVTANAMAHDRQKCLDAGMDDYLSKPMREKELVEMFRRWIGEREVRRPERPASLPATAETRREPVSMPDYPAAASSGIGLAPAPARPAAPAPALLLPTAAPSPEPAPAPKPRPVAAPTPAPALRPVAAPAPAASPVQAVPPSRPAAPAPIRIAEAPAPAAARPSPAPAPRAPVTPPAAPIAPTAAPPRVAQSVAAQAAPLFARAAEAPPIPQSPRPAPTPAPQAGPVPPRAPVPAPRPAPAPQPAASQLAPAPAPRAVAPQPTLAASAPAPAPQPAPAAARASKPAAPSVPSGALMRIEDRMQHAASLPTIDEEQFAVTERTMGKRFPAFASLYIRDVQRYARDIAAGLKAGSVEAIIQPAHTLKSSSRIVGAVQSSYWAEALEHRAKQMREGSMDLNELVTLTQAMSQSLSEALREIGRRATIAEKAAS